MKYGSASLHNSDVANPFKLGFMQVQWFYGWKVDSCDSGFKSNQRFKSKYKNDHPTIYLSSIGLVFSLSKYKIERPLSTKFLNHFKSKK